MKIIHSGRLPDFRSVSTTRSRLVAFLRRCPDEGPGSPSGSLGQLVQVQLLEQIPDRLGAHTGLEDAVAHEVKKLAVLGFVQRLEDLDALDLLDLGFVALALTIGVEAIVAVNLRARQTASPRGRGSISRSSGS